VSDARFRRWPAALAGALAAAGGLIGCGSPAGGAPPAKEAACPVTRVASEVLPSVVTIAASGPGSGGVGAGTGSGEVIRSDGYILTNDHVIAAAAHDGTVGILFADGTTASATITGRDALTDLAVLKVRPRRGLRPVEFGSSESVRVGEPVVALGAPLGLSGTVTSGIVSALDRTVQVPSEADRSALLVSGVQTDAAINPGNSGGALVNCENQLVGIPTAGATVPGPAGGSAGGSIGVGFAIPVDLARTISDEIISGGRATHAYFGLRTVPIPPSAAAAAGTDGGLYVAGVVSGGPAEQAGLRQSDIITRLDGTAATSNVQLQKLTLTRQAGDRVRVDYLRDGRSRTATITLASQP